MSKLLRSFLPLTAIMMLLLAMNASLGTFVYAQGNFGVGPEIVPPIILTQTGGETNIINLVRTIINYFLGFLGILTLAIVIYGGFMYVTAGVNESGAETGKKVLTYSAIGIVIILLSFVFVNMLLRAGTGNPATP